MQNSTISVNITNTKQIQQFQLILLKEIDKINLLFFFFSTAGLQADEHQAPNKSNILSGHG